MKRKLILLFALLLVLLCAACGGESAEPEGNCALYYATDPEFAKGGDAIAPEYCELVLPEDRAAAAELLLARYWEGPESSELNSPLPGGLKLLGIQEHSGRVEVNVSASYGSLSGVDLTLADSCLTMTLTQIPGIYSVTVLVEGKTLEYRGEQELQARDVLLSSAEDLVGTVRATLWFVDEITGELVSQDHMIPVYEGKTRAESVLDALAEAPAEELLSVVPEEYRFLTVRVEDGVCYVNLPGSELAILQGSESIMLQAAAKSLCSLSTVSSVCYLVDGAEAVWYGSARVEELYTLESIPTA